MALLPFAPVEDFASNELPPRSIQLKPFILGAAVGYSPEKVRWFVESARRVGLHRAIKLFVGPRDEALMAYLDDVGIDHGVMDLSAWWLPERLARRRFNGGRIRVLHRIASDQAARLPRGGDTRRKMVWGLFSCLHDGSAVRYWCYLRELRRVSKEYTNVLVTDVRDVVFQADPFARVPGHGLMLFTENHGMPIREERATRNWIEVTYGRARTERILPFPTLCSGTTIGDSASMIAYLEAISDELLRHTHSVASFPGIDQGIHNWLYHHQRLPVAQLCDTFEGPVATLGTEPMENFRFDNLRRLLNRDGSLVPVVHQYDRHPSLEKSLAEWLGPA